MPQTVAFYSYKGGVGRSLTLVNAAALLAKRGKRVLCLDFDLEAGGLHTILGLKSTEIPFTLLDLLIAPGLPAVERAVLNLTDRIGECIPGGQLLLLPTVSEVMKVNRVFEMRRDLPTLLEELISQVEDIYYPHFVIIDSRSGFAELAAAPLRRADKLVCVLRPNKQNMDGLRILLDILDSLRDPPDSLLVLSQVPQVAESKPRLEALQRLLGAGRLFDVVIPYDALLALDENVLAITAPTAGLVAHYNVIADWLLKDVV